MAANEPTFKALRWGRFGKGTAVFGRSGSWSDASGHDFASQVFTVSIASMPLPTWALPRNWAALSACRQFST